MKLMQPELNKAYEELIIYPLRKAVEEAGGVAVVAMRMGINPYRLRMILYKYKGMEVATLMRLCTALNITLTFIDMNVAKQL